MLLLHRFFSYYISLSSQNVILIIHLQIKLNIANYQKFTLFIPPFCQFYQQFFLFFQLKYPQMKKSISQNSASKIHKAASLNTNLRQSQENLPPQQPTPTIDKESQRIIHLESNLNRVCLQQDALMPLIQMIEYIPAIQRTDSIIKGLIRKVEENDNRIQLAVFFIHLKLLKERKLEKKLKDSNNPDQQEGSANKLQQSSINNLGCKVKDMELQMSNLYRWYETKLKEESLILQRNMEQKLERQKTDLQKSFYADNTKSHSKTISSIANNDQAAYQKQILSSVEVIVQESLESFRVQFQTQIDNIRSQVADVKDTINKN